MTCTVLLEGMIHSICEDESIKLEVVSRCIAEVAYFGLPFSLNFICLFVCLFKTHRECVCAPIHWFAPQLPSQLKLGASKAFQVFHVGGRNPVTGAISCCLPVHNLELGVESGPKPGHSIWDAGVSINRPNARPLVRFSHQLFKVSGGMGHVQSRVPISI